MPEGISSARPGRLVRFGETSAAIDEGLATRFGILEDALARYRATCEVAYRFSPTVETADVLRAWSGATKDLGQWVDGVGQGFLATQAVEVYMHGSGNTDPEDLYTFDDDQIVGNMPEAYQDDPFLGVPVGGWSVSDSEVSVDDPDAFGAFLEELGLDATVMDQVVGSYADLLGDTPRGVPVTLVITESELLFYSDGTIVRRVTRTEAAALLILPGHVPNGLEVTGRWLGRVGAALDFATGAYTQWQGDAALPTGERVLRAGTEGLGVLAGSAGGGWAGGAAGGALGGAAAGLVCGPGAPVCSSVLGLGGAIIGGIGGAIAGGEIGGWLVDFLPWMDPPPEPKPGEYDLDALRDELGQEDGELSEYFESVDAATSLVGLDLALAETADRPDLRAHLEPLLPDRDELLRIMQGLPEPDQVTPTGTTTTTTTTPSPLPTPSPQPGPAPTPPEPVTPTGTTTPTTVPGG